PPLRASALPNCPRTRASSSIPAHASSSSPNPRTPRQVHACTPSPARSAPRSALIISSASSSARACPSAYRASPARRLSLLRACHARLAAFLSLIAVSASFPSPSSASLSSRKKSGNSSRISSQLCHVASSLGNDPDDQELPQAIVVAHFRDYHPEKFFGQGDPRIVDEWVQGLEMIFEVMDCPDRYRVLCAQIQLTGDARLWWNAYWSMRPGEKEGCTWDQFKELIRGKYYLSYNRAEMERQFLALKQGTRSVDEYERECNIPIFNRSFGRETAYSRRRRTGVRRGPYMFNMRSVYFQVLFDKFIHVKVPSSKVVELLAFSVERWPTAVGLAYSERTTAEGSVHQARSAMSVEVQFNDH
ncbi:Unknown protein, partial [Striga hermonthica]